MKLGLIGKPQCGKTTVFNAACGKNEPVGDFGQAVHRAIIRVLEPRVDVLAKLLDSKRLVYGEIEMLDAPGLSGKGKEAGGLEIHQDIRQMESLLLVIDAFSHDARPEADIQSAIDEMMILDQALIESNLEKKSRIAKLTGDKTGAAEIKLLERCLEILEQERPLIDMELMPAEEKQIRGYTFLTQKPLIIAINIAEDDIGRSDQIVAHYAKYVVPEKRGLALLCGKVEMDLVGMDKDEQKEFLDDLGIASPAVEQVIKLSYDLLGLITFLTVSEKEARSWPIRKGATAQKSAGIVHTDMERGFIRAEVTRFEDYVEYKTAAALKAAGKNRLEGKDYIVQDGDVILFRFNV